MYLVKNQKRRKTIKSKRDKNKNNLVHMEGLDRIELGRRNKELQENKGSKTCHAK
jgi:hypothetical protein